MPEAIEGTAQKGQLKEKRGSLDSWFGNKNAPTANTSESKTDLGKLNESMGSTNGKFKTSTKPRLQFLLRVLAAVSLLGTLTGLVILHGIGNWLVREDALHPATAIAVLSGNIPVRALEAARLYHEGYAKEIWLTHPGDHADALEVLGISYPSEDDVNFRILRRQGVPSKAIHILDASIVNTADELDAISFALADQGGDAVIIVTNKSHTRRVHLLWNRYFSARGKAMVHAVSADDFEADHWWRYSGSMTQVVHEVLGILNTWAGMPVQPAPSPQNVAAAEGSMNRIHDGSD
jgi:uncharacterized SAM-binding protein YcdF (DUF218 family)